MITFILSLAIAYVAIQVALFTVYFFELDDKLLKKIDPIFKGLSTKFHEKNKLSQF